MNAEQFNKTVENRIKQIKVTLVKKAEEYAEEDDRMHNFNRAAQVLGITPEEALVGMQSKHIVSILDMVDAVAKLEEDEGIDVTHEFIEEKIGDAINYFILLEAMLKERSIDG